MSPELILSDTFVRTLEADVWAWACLILEVMYDRLPHAGATEMAVVRRLFHGELPASVDTLPIAPALKELITRCWARDPDLRPSMDQCLNVIRQIEHSTQ